MEKTPGEQTEYDWWTFKVRKFSRDFLFSFKCYRELSNKDDLLDNLTAQLKSNSETLRQVVKNIDNHNSDIFLGKSKTRVRYGNPKRETERGW